MIGFISKKKIKKEVKKLWREYGHDIYDSGCCNGITTLCRRLGVEPPHNKIRGRVIPNETRHNNN